MSAVIPDLAKLERFSGGVAALWLFTASHTHFVIRVTRAIPEEEIFILGSGCTRLEASAAWRFGVPNVELTTDGMLALRDRDQAFVAFCESIRIEVRYQILPTRRGQL